MRLVLLTLVLLAAPAAVAAPDGFRKSDPLTKRAVMLAGNQGITVHCAGSDAIYRATGSDEDGLLTLGRANRATDEIELPPATCAPMERWLKGKRVNMAKLGEALFTLGHEIGHVKLDTSDEGDVDCYASRKFNTLARLFGVKSAATLRQLRIAAQPILFC